MFTALVDSLNSSFPINLKIYNLPFSPFQVQQPFNPIAFKQIPESCRHNLLRYLYNICFLYKDILPIGKSNDGYLPNSFIRLIIYRYNTDVFLCSIEHNEGLEVL